VRDVGTYWDNHWGYENYIREMPLW
jgi:hypothetical protein